MRASIILALVGLVSNMTEAIQVTAAVNSDEYVQLYESKDCTDAEFTDVDGPFTVCRRRFCESRFAGAIIPAGASLVVKLKDPDTKEMLDNVTIEGDGTCVDVKEYVKVDGGYESCDDFKIAGGNVVWP